MLLPPSLHEWVEQDDLVHFIIDSLETINLSSALGNERGTGDREYPPAMMLALLIYCYAQGIFSSLKIERSTYQHVSVRYLAANHHPDHDTIPEFRRMNGASLKQVCEDLPRL